MVPAEHANPYPGIDKIGEHAQCPEVAAEYDRSVLEPEVEQVAVYQEVARDLGDLREEPDEGCLVLGRGRSEVRIRDDDRGPFHGAKYRVRLTNVKRFRAAGRDQ